MGESQGQNQFNMPDGTGYVIFVTEKPSVGQEYRKVLNVQQEGKTDGYVKGYSQTLKRKVIITWCVGHLCSLAYPEEYDEELKKWSLNTLPFLPQQYKYSVIDTVKKQFNIIKGLYHDANLDAIYYAGDSGREGIYIQALVRQMAGHKNGIVEKVVWIDSFTEAEILKGIRDAKDIQAYRNMINAGYMRAIEDYAVGINFSRALSCKYGYPFKQYIGEAKSSIAVGRVMTCVLGMVVEREREIRSFTEIPYYKLVADSGFTTEWKADEKSVFYESPYLYNESGFKTQERAQFLLDTLNKDKTLTVEKLKVSEEKKNAPLLYNLAELQFDCSKKYKISPDETLAIIQSLYEKKLVTYPRTDARVLSSAVAAEISTNLNGIAKLGYKRDVVMAIAKNQWHKSIVKSRYVDDSKITDHFAIIPTGYIVGADTLKGKEQDVYRDIIDRFLCIFFPPAIYAKTEIVMSHSMRERFYGSKKVIKEYGYMEVLDDKPVKEISGIEGLKKGQQIQAAFSIKEGKTTPPKRYSSGSIVIAMENAGKLIEDEALREQIKGSGIGTSATRAEIIKKLVKKNYLQLNTKTQILTPAISGEALYDVVKGTVPVLLKPEMTANWEKGLTGVEAGKVAFTEYRQKLEKYIAGEVEKIKNNSQTFKSFLAN